MPGHVWAPWTAHGLAGEEGRGASRCLPGPWWMLGDPGTLLGHPQAVGPWVGGWPLSPVCLAQGTAPGGCIVLRGPASAPHPGGHANSCRPRQFPLFAAIFGNGGLICFSSQTPE